MNEIVFDKDVLVTLIGTIGTVMVAGFGVLTAMVARSNAKLNKTHEQALDTNSKVEDTKKLAEEAKEQVTNAHTSNFREEVTDSFNAVRNKLDEMAEQQGKMSNSLKAAHGKINKVDLSVSELRASDKAQWSKLDQIGNTDDFLGGSNAD